MILLDTNALIWIEQGHGRVRSLMRTSRQLCISPASVLELRFLEEAGRIRLPKGSLDPIVHDERWVVDDVPAASWFLRAADLTWTRDPFDRLIAAHALLRGWQLATADTRLAERLGPTAIIQL